MIKIIFSAIVLTAVVGCTKEKTAVTEKTETKDSVIVQKPATSSAPIVADGLKVLSPDDAAKFLNTKNDTLYVTNFFATWCGPCVREIPHFKDKIAEVKGQPVKISFVSLDTKSAWEKDVPKFVEKQGIQGNTYLLDGGSLDEAFFSKNFKEWNGSAIPFTYMRKGDKTDEYLGMMTPEILDSKIKSFK
ncbi:redoxin [Chryseobacterium sp. Leaf180]|uniref:TlpA family protein disulfide reductase n=1 Tax=Chryseobacterium sp. Leaf180 TaxID=1736289 RepID=UPI0006FA6592|nr:TlpA family protein disulfide reductase [Chryseobacterium sp. Leaf180]KQR94688.1 redoxin [Chryseobacterium sp. Leaf180]